MQKKKLVILGSTGSIGRSTLDLVRAFPDRFEVLGISGFRNTAELERQIREFQPRFAVSGSEGLHTDLGATELLPLTDLVELAAHPDSDLVVAAIVGIAGLRPTAAALRAGKTVLLANKESLVCAGRVLLDLCTTHGGTLIPIDSEHSAIFQLLEGRSRGDLERLTLTASGGPFLDSSKEDLARVTPEMAVKHPRWSMGPKISIDSATLVNKALELIEASWLFAVPETQISVVIHPESIIHSFIGFRDGTQFAQLSVPDMKGPIAFGLSYPHGRLQGVMERLDLAQLGSLQFRALDNERFPAVEIARSCLRAGGASCAVFNSANERAVALFLEGALSFQDIVPFIEGVVSKYAGRDYCTIDDLLTLDDEIRRRFHTAAR
jgi:1-deoxy-D-xylulose-5-phosphate reductoisomerase